MSASHFAMGFLESHGDHQRQLDHRHQQSHECQPCRLRQRRHRCLEANSAGSAADALAALVARRLQAAQCLFCAFGTPTAMLHLARGCPRQCCVLRTRDANSKAVSSKTLARGINILVTRNEVYSSSPHQHALRHMPRPSAALTDERSQGSACQPVPRPSPLQRHRHLGLHWGRTGTPPHGWPLSMPDRDSQAPVDTRMGMSG